MYRIGVLVLLLQGAAIFSVVAQSADGPAAPVIDTIIVNTSNVFSPDEARSNVFFRIANGIRFTTRKGIVRRELLFREGEPYDSALVAETERNLRFLGVFRVVSVDTMRVGDRLAAVVNTADGWSTQLQLSGRVSAGVFTWSAGITERNFLGTANPVGISYRKDPDRTAFTLLGNFNRVFGTPLALGGFYDNLSDGQRGRWALGVPYRSFLDRRAVQWFGEGADQRILEYFVFSTSDVDTVRYKRQAFVNQFMVSKAPNARSGQYLRVGFVAQLRQEKYILEQDTGLAVPDTVTGAFGGFLEYRKANFKVVTHFNGFAHQEDLDLSSTLRVGTWIAPSAFGYDRSGIGPELIVGTGIGLPNGYIRLNASGHGLFTGAGLDSGFVSVRAALGVQFFRRQATFLAIRAGAQQSPAPGAEFDLGHGLGPRNFAPHAFVGTRAVWGTFEHRWFLFDDLFGLLGLGVAVYVDYGGAWYPAQGSRTGGNVGFGLRTGAARASGVNIGRIDLGYRFGDGWSGNRWAFSIGRGIPF